MQAMQNNNGRPQQIQDSQYDEFAQQAQLYAQQQQNNPTNPFQHQNNYQHGFDENGINHQMYPPNFQNQFQNPNIHQFQQYQNPNFYNQQPPIPPPNNGNSTSSSSSYPPPPPPDSLYQTAPPPPSSAIAPPPPPPPPEDNDNQPPPPPPEDPYVPPPINLKSDKNKQKYNSRYDNKQIDEKSYYSNISESAQISIEEKRLELYTKYNKRVKKNPEAACIIYESRPKYRF